jgi:putative transcriptional regulator
MRLSSTLDTRLPVKHPCHVKNRVGELRGLRGMSQGQLATALGVSRQTINSIENGRYLPSLPLALAIARNFEESVEAIFIDDQEEAS